MATSVGMAFVGGYVDVVGVVLLFGLFVAHATGNLIMLGVSLAGSGEGLAAKLLALPVFIATVGSGYALIRSRKARGKRSEVLVLAAQAALLLAFMVLTALALPARDADQWTVLLAGLVGVAAMAVQNLGARVVFADLAPTTMMTGNVTQSAIDLVDLVIMRGRPDAILAARILKTWPPVAAFALGAVSGAIGVLLAGAWSLGVAVTAVLMVIVLHGAAARHQRA